MVFLTFMSAKCSKDTPVSNPPTNNIPYGASKMGVSGLAMGLDLFQEVVKDKPNENVLISPYSIQTAMLMAANGAKSQTLNEVLDVMHSKGMNIHDANSEALKLRNALLKPGNPQLKIANAFFYDPQRLAPEADYMANLSKYFMATSYSKNFELTATLDQINQWVKDNTLNKIPKIIDQITNDDVAFIINALYFKGDWLKPFAEEMTFNSEFNTAKGSKKQVPFMNHQGNVYAAEKNGFTMVDLPFADSTYSLSLMMPTQTSNSWIQNVNHQNINALWTALKSEYVMLALPKFELDFKSGLIPYFKALGMQLPFNRNADFSAMGQPLSGSDLFIGQIEHAAVLKIDEKGAEGAAVTSVGMVTTSMPPLIRFDRPFVLILRHIESGAPLFVGFVAEP